MITAIIFDMDGTLIDSVDFHAKAWQRTFERFGHRFEYAAIRAQIGKGGDQLMPALLPDEVVERDGEKMEEFRKDLFKNEYLPLIQAFPSVRDLFLRVQADGKRTAVASSAKGDELETYKKITRIEDLVEKETTSDDAERSKPYPDIFQAALHRLDAPPGQAIVIGDTPHDAKAAHAAGMAVLGVLCGGFAEADLRQAGCAEIYDDPADLLKNYDRSMAARN